MCNFKIAVKSFERHYEEQSDVVIQKKPFYVRRTVGLWIAALNTLQTVQSFAMTDENINLCNKIKHV